MLSPTGGSLVWLCHGPKTKAPLTASHGGWGSKCPSPCLKSNMLDPVSLSLWLPPHQEFMALRISERS